MDLVTLRQVGHCRLLPQCSQRGHDPLAEKVNRPITEWACAGNNLGYEEAFGLHEYPMPVANTPDF